MYATLSDGTKLFYDVYGSRLSVQSDQVIEKPTIVFLHGGPGIADHTLYVSFWSQLAEIAQVIFIDMRGHGKSDLGKSMDWNLARWGKDVFEFCEEIGLKRPIIAGFSFGGWVALSYVTQFPEHPLKLILCNTEAQVDFEMRIEAYRKKGGDTAAEIVRRLTYAPDEKTAGEYIEHCLPLFCKKPYTAAELNRCVCRAEIWDVFAQNEYGTFNFLPKLSQIQCPTLILAGAEDPEHPQSSAEKMAQKILNSTYALIEDAGDPVFRDKPTEVLHVIKTFIQEV